MNGDEGTEPWKQSVSLQKIAEGDRQAFAALYGELFNRLLTYILPFTHESRPDAEDIIEEVLITLWEKREILLTVRSVQAYAFRIARNKLSDWRRKHFARERLERQHLPASPGTVASPEEDLLFTRYHRIAEEAIGKLTEKRRQIFLLYTQDEVSTPEIARRLGISTSVVKKQLAAATQFIKEYLRNHAEWSVVVILVMFPFQ